MISDSFNGCLGALSVSVTMMWRMWIAQDDQNPTRRISFGDYRDRAHQFAESVVGWSVRSDTDPGWEPITGLPPGSDQATAGTS